MRRTNANARSNRGYVEHGRGHGVGGVPGLGQAAAAGAAAVAGIALKFSIMPATMLMAMDPMRTTSLLISVLASSSMLVAKSTNSWSARPALTPLATTLARSPVSLGIALMAVSTQHSVFSQPMRCA